MHTVTFSSSLKKKLVVPEFVLFQLLDHTVFIMSRSRAPWLSFAISSSFPVVSLFLTTFLDFRLYLLDTAVQFVIMFKTPDRGLTIFMSKVISLRAGFMDITNVVGKSLRKSSKWFVRVSSVTFLWRIWAAISPSDHFQHRTSWREPWFEGPIPLADHPETECSGLRLFIRSSDNVWERHSPPLVLSRIFYRTMQQLQWLPSPTVLRSIHEHSTLEKWIWNCKA
jgi:hypothetical protein